MESLESEEKDQEISLKKKGILEGLPEADEASSKMTLKKVIRQQLQTNRIAILIDWLIDFIRMLTHTSGGNAIVVLIAPQ